MKRKKIIILILAIVSILLCLIANIDFHKRTTYTYSPEKAVEYSYKYIVNRNPDFPAFESNCITFVSQCLYAGGIEMDTLDIKNVNKTKIVGTNKKWFCYSFDNNPYLPLSFYVSSSFSNINDFVSYWSKLVPYDTVSNSKENKIKLRQTLNVGDILIFHGKKHNHSAIIVNIDDYDIYYNSNTNDRVDYPLSYITTADYPEISFLTFVKNKNNTIEN